MFLMRYLAGVMVWVTILLVNVVLIGLTIYCFSMAGLLGNSAWAQVRPLFPGLRICLSDYCCLMHELQPTSALLLLHSLWPQSVHDSVGSFGDPTVVERSTWKWIAITAAVVAGVVLLLTLLMISRIRIAIACIKVRAEARPALAASGRSFCIAIFH